MTQQLFKFFYRNIPTQLTLDSQECKYLGNKPGRFCLLCGWTHGISHEMPAFGRPQHVQEVPPGYKDKTEKM